MSKNTLPGNFPGRVFFVDMRAIFVDNHSFMCNNIYMQRGEDMKSAIEETLRHIQFLNRHLNTCDLQCMTVVILLELGIPTKRAGFDYIKKGILLMCDDPALLITKGVYPEIGRRYSSPVSNFQVEQSIRSAISDAWLQRNKRVWGYYFPDSTDGGPKKPTNAEFITRIARVLELWQCCQKEVCYENE